MSATPEPSLAECFEAQRGLVYRWARTLTRRHDDALDLTQEVFLRLLAYRGPRQPAPVLRAWLRRVTHNLAIDGWRRRDALRGSAALEPNDPLHNSALDDADALESSEQAVRVRTALAKLSAQQRLVLLAKVCDGLTFSEIAAELEIAPSTAKTHYLRALETLRNEPQLQLLAGSKP
jgi:RNA polymerase sigma-70 factor (ECF subfamily)